MGRTDTQRHSHTDTHTHTHTDALTDMTDSNIPLKWNNKAIKYRNLEYIYIASFIHRVVWSISHLKAG